MGARGDSAVWQVGEHEVHVTHLGKLYWPAGVTKGDVLRYYLAIAPTAMPHFRERPATMRVFPEGALGPSFYQRDPPEHAPDWLRRVAYHPKTTKTPSQMSTLTIIEDAAGLIWLANAGSLEFHLWSTQLHDLERPDQAIFDLDPGEAATFAAVCRAALGLREELERDGIQSYPKTSGGRGLHVYVPLAAEQTFQQVRAWVKAIAERLAAADPALVAVAHRATHRGEQITVDHAQNSIGRNTAAPYTLRARSAQPVVSTPLRWEELEAGGVDPEAFTPPIVLERVRRFGDVFASAIQGGQHLPRL
jgi:bifunctional non-homologous end joining protein LigD